MFGYDWHWRAEISAHGRGTSCPAKQWTSSQRILHDAMSCDLLELLPLPLLIVAGSCPSINYRKTLSTMARSVEVPIMPNLVIPFNLDFRADGLRRIAACIDHPSSLYFNPKRPVGYTIAQDAAVNFFSWLAGRDCEELTFLKKRNQHQRGVPGSAPLALLWAYVRKERILNRNLYKNEFDIGFWTWSHTFLKENPEDVLRQGHSIVTKITQELQNRRRVTLNEPHNVTKMGIRNRGINANRYKYDTKEYWDTCNVRIGKNGDLRIHVSSELPALKLRLGKSISSKVQEANNLTIHFTDQGLSLKVAEQVIYNRSRERLLRLSVGLQWAHQFDKELLRKRGAAKAKMGGSTLSGDADHTVR